MTSNSCPHWLPHPQEFILDPECSCGLIILWFLPGVFSQSWLHLGISQQAGSKAGLLLPYTPQLWRKRQCPGMV